MATTPERREAGSKGDIENVLLKANDDNYRWPDGGGSRSRSLIIARCNMEDGEMNETGALEDGDDLFPGTSSSAKRNAMTPSINERHDFSHPAQYLTEPTIVSDETFSPAKKSSAFHNAHPWTDLRKPLPLKGSAQIDNAVLVIDDRFNDSMEEEFLNEQVNQERNSDYADNDALSTTNNHSAGDVLSTTTASSINAQEVDFDYEMDALCTNPANSEPFLSGIASLTPESSASSPVLQPMIMHNQNYNNNDAMDVIEEQTSIVATSRNNYDSTGRVGLSNLGNTCFMNSTLQCLAHTDILREYFTSGIYKEHLNIDNPLGTGGELATAFAELLTSMWSTKGNNAATSSSLPYSTGYSSSYTAYNSNVVYPRNFKYSLGRHAEQFIGYDQHDSQELATYLLDALHEDTNRVTKKPYIEKPEQKVDESDEEAAAKAWDIHLQREDSFVTRTFVGQVKSKVTCPIPGCGRVSTTYDPFMYLSVPIPGTSDVTIDATFVSLDPTKSNEKISITVPKSFSVSDYLERIGELVGAASEDLIAADIFKNDVYEIYTLSDPITKLFRNQNVDVFLYQLEPLVSIQQQQEKFEDVPESGACHRSTSCSSSSEKDTQNLVKSCLANDFSFYDDEYQWASILCSHTSDVIFNRLHNTKRSTHQERMDFLAKLQTYIIREKERMLNSGQHTEELACDSRIDTVLSSAAHPKPSISSSIFHGVDNMSSLLTLQYCAEKFRQWCSAIQAEKQKSVEGGIILQVLMQDESLIRPYYSRGTDLCFTIPLIMRIPRSMTVFELRLALSKRLSRALEANDLNGWTLQGVSSLPVGMDDCKDFYNIHEDVNESMKKPKISPSPKLTNVELVLAGIPMTYQNTNQSSHTKAHRLGCLEAGSENILEQATSDDPDELAIVSDFLGRDSGRVFLLVSRKSTRYNFNVEAWEHVAPSTHQEEMPDASGRDLLSCIKKYCQKEQLEKSEMWFCNRCQAHVRAWKHIHLFRTPPILIIQLKRFHYSSSTHHRDKIDAWVDFPLEGLDLTEFVLNRNEEEEAIYDCYAVSNHYGGLGGGHYTAFALDKDGRWCHFDDSVVTEVDDAAVVSKAAYVLYYRRREQKKIKNASEERLTLDSGLKYSLSPVSITTDASSSGSLDEILDAPYRNESNDFAV